MSSNVQLMFLLLLLEALYHQYHTKAQTHFEKFERKGECTDSGQRVCGNCISHKINGGSACFNFSSTSCNLFLLTEFDVASRCTIINKVDMN